MNDADTPLPARPSLASLTGTPVLVVGAGGFIGRHLTALLAERGARVTAGVRCGGARLASRRFRPPHAVAEFDGAVAGSLGRLIGEVRPAFVVNLLAYGVHADQRDLQLAQRINVECVGELVDALADARDAGALPPWPAARLVHAGTVAEYGEASGDLVESTPTQPTTLYGRTKLAGTLLLLARARERALRSAVARLFMVYGGGERPPRLLPSLLAAAEREGPIDLTAGKQRRDFTWVGDVAEGLVRLAAAQGVGEGEVVHLATGRLTAVRDFVLAAAQELRIETGRLRFGALPSDGAEQRLASVSVERLRQLTNWIPDTSPTDGVRRTLAGL